MSIIGSNILAGASGQQGYTISRSVRLRSSASAYFSRSLSTANTTTWTVSFWFKSGLLSSSVAFPNFFEYVETTGAGRQGGISPSDAGSTYQFSFYKYAPSTYTMRKIPAMVFRDPSAWYHAVIVWNTTVATAEDRAQIWINGTRVTNWTTNTNPAQNETWLWSIFTNSFIGAQNRNNGGSIINPWDGYLTEVNFIDGQALTPSSFGETDAVTGVWKPKKYGGTYGNNGFYLNFSDNSDVINIGYDQRLGSYSFPLRTQGTVFGGFTTAGGNAAAFDGNTNQAGGTSAACARAPAPAAGYTSASAIGRDWGSGVTRTVTAFRIYAPNNGGILGLTSTGIGYKLQGSNDGSTYTDLTTAATTSGATSEVVTVTSGITTSTAYRYHRVVFNGDGANNLYVAEVQFFEAGSYVIGNNWYPNNISVTSGVTYDSMIDTPTPYADGGNGRGNYAVLNPLSLGSTVTLSNGNLTMTEVGTYATTVSSVAMTSGKWYVEMTVGSNTYAGTVGIAKLGYSPTSRFGFQANTWSYNYDGGLYYNSTTLGGNATFTTNDVIGIAFDADNLTISFYKNGTLQSTQYTSANSGLSAGEFYFATGHINSTSNWNFGQRPFSYTPPSGFKALNTFNLPEPTIKKGNQYFDATTYTGNGTSQNVVNSGGFQPDFVWYKDRSVARDHGLFDSIRGALDLLSSNTSGVASSVAGTLTSFNSNGYSIGSTSNANGNGETYVGWQWKANGAGSSNTAGTISATVSANQAAGFSIIKFTGNGVTTANGASIGHGLGVAPKLFIIKPLSTTGDWWAYTDVIDGSLDYLKLNSTTLAANSSNSVPTSSVIYMAGSSINTNAVDFICYAFAPVAGYSAVGKYVGNGSSDGPFIFCNFRPRFIMLKNTAAATNWRIHDTARDPENTSDLTLYPNISNAEDSGFAIDILSNGFKLRFTDSGSNGSGNTIIFAAFAENPFKYSLAR